MPRIWSFVMICSPPTFVADQLDVSMKYYVLSIAPHPLTLPGYETGWLLGQSWLVELWLLFLALSPTNHWILFISYKVILEHIIVF